ncbi:YbaY family lipoprotein [Pseudomonas sp. TH43]|uniref:YbaY family lipoprotein n=1 Tax=Pseudomonas sp. TH43 TaxID=2796407 RepID=UPI0019133C07|nr:YbaY family lipoprotein [Pseudomonas sp. TH43]MBK5375778.1 YbaY family lipoprotein [Pseudomonas sp. TH43]
MPHQAVKTLSGSVHYLARIGLLPGSTLTVSLLDITQADAPAKELTAQVIPEVATAGLHFNLTYKLADVLPGHTYVIHARITLNEQLIFTSKKPHLVVLGVDYVQGQSVLVDLA